MTDSFAKSPVKTATEAGQLSRSTPIGSKAGTRAFPTEDSSVCEAAVSPVQTFPWMSKLLSSPMTSIIGTMNRPARQRKPVRRSQVWRRMCFRRGQW